MLAEDNNAEGSTNRVSLRLTCGSCQFFNSGIKRFEQPCSMLGQEEFSAACREYVPDMRPLMNVKTMDIEALASILGRMSQRQIELMAYVLRNAKDIKKTKLEFGQTVVFSIDGQDYIENYFSAVVIGASRDGRTVYLSSDLNELNQAQCMLTMMRSSVLSLEEFHDKHRKLITRGRLRAPSNQYSQRKNILQLLRLSETERKDYMERLKTKPDTYQPPNIDVVPQHWLDKRMLDNSLRKRNRDPEKDNGKTPEGRAATKPAKKVFKIARYEDQETA